MIQVVKIKKLFSITNKKSFEIPNSRIGNLSFLELEKLRNLLLSSFSKVEINEDRKKLVLSVWK